MPPDYLERHSGRLGQDIWTKSPILKGASDGAAIALLRCAALNRCPNPLASLAHKPFQEL